VGTLWAHHRRSGERDVRRGGGLPPHRPLAAERGSAAHQRRGVACRRSRVARDGERAAHATERTVEPQLADGDDVGESIEVELARGSEEA